jgi:hypothetical protein
MFCASPDGLAADWQRINRHCQNGADSDVNVALTFKIVGESWLQLPAAIRHVIVALVQATLK